MLIAAAVTTSLLVPSTLTPAGLGRPAALAEITARMHASVVESAHAGHLRQT